MAIASIRDFAQTFNPVAKTLFEDAFGAADTSYRELCTILPSTLPSESYVWISENPLMREFVDERKVSKLSEYSYSIRNRKWESTIGIQREVIEDEQHGQIKMRVQSLGEMAALHYDDLVFQLIAGGETTACYDGQPFFGAHQVAGVGVNNRITASLSFASLTAAIAGLKRTPLDNGQPGNVKATHLVVPPELEVPALQLVHSLYSPQTREGDTGGMTVPGMMAVNPLQGTLKVVTSARLPSATEWYLLACNRAIRPFILQQRIEAQFVALDGTDGHNETEFMRDELLYGARSRDNAGYGLWQFAVKSSGTTAS